MRWLLRKARYVSRVLVVSVVVSVLATALARSFGLGVTVGALVL
jgi:hypothetical protein